MVGRWLSFGAWCHPNASAFETPSHATRELGPGDRATKGLRPRDSSAGEARRKCWELVGDMLSHGTCGWSGLTVRSGSRVQRPQTERGEESVL